MFAKMLWILETVMGPTAELCMCILPMLNPLQSFPGIFTTSSTKVKGFHPGSNADYTPTGYFGLKKKNISFFSLRSNHCGYLGYCVTQQ